MPLDAICMSAMLPELREIVGSKIDKVQQPAKDMLIFSIRGRNGNKKMLVSTGTGSARVQITTESFENPKTPPMFCMLMRKHLVGARIDSITQPGFDRLLIFDLNTFDDMGVEVKKQLVIELMGRNSNIILVGTDGNIIDCLRRVDRDMSPLRQVLPGLIYRFPPSRGKPVFTQTTSAERYELFKSADKEKPADKWLQNTFAGLSPLICREICYRSCGETSKPIVLFSDEEKEAFLSEMENLLALFMQGNFQPTMIVGSEKPRDISFMEIRQYENAAKLENFDSFSTLLETFYTRRDKQELMRRKSQTLYKSVKSAHDRTVKNVIQRRQELLKTGERELNRKRGDLITANMYRLKKGDLSFRTEDYYEEESPEILIPLDPLKSPQENAARYYKLYNKAKTAEKYLKELIEKGERDEKYLESVMDEILRAESEAELVDIKRELTDTGFINRKKSKQKVKYKETAPLHFISSTGFHIYVGRNNTQNDKLTTKLARRTDMWLHTQKVHGSHVIISCEGGEPDEKTIFEAATLSAYYSQSRGGAKVSIDYTQVRFVKKPSGSMPGNVIYTDYQTIIVDPEEKIVQDMEKIK